MSSVQKRYFRISSGENPNSIERELERANTSNGSASHNDTGAFSRQKGIPLQKNEFRKINSENEIPRHDRLLESMEIYLLK